MNKKNNGQIAVLLIIIVILLGYVVFANKSGDKASSAAVVNSTPTTVAAVNGYEVKTSVMNIQPAGTTFTSAFCSSGKRVLGGGYTTDTANGGVPRDIYAVQSFPQGAANGTFPNMWYVGLTNKTTTIVKATVYAICAN